MNSEVLNPPFLCLSPGFRYRPTLSWPRAQLGRVQWRSTSAEMAPAAMSKPPSSLNSLRPFHFSPSSFLLCLLLSFFLLLSCPGLVSAGAGKKNCSSGGDPCQEGGSVRKLQFNVNKETLTWLDFCLQKLGWYTGSNPFYWTLSVHCTHWKVYMQENR